MPTPTELQSSRARALWVIASSLVIIAGCLVLLVLKVRLDWRNARAISSAAQPEATLDTTKALAEADATRVHARINQRTTVTSSTTASNHIELAIADSKPPAALVPREPTPGPAMRVANRLVFASNTIIGRVKLRGMPPPERLVPVSSLPDCPELRTTPPTTHDFVVGTNGELANVFVSFEGKITPKPYSHADTNVHFTLSRCELFPAVTGATTGESIRIRNGSGSNHRIRLGVVDGSAAESPEPYPLQARLAPDTTRKFPAFRAPEDFFQIQCLDHPWEVAALCIVQNPFFAVTDTNGMFVISGLPAGKYRVRARHPKISGPSSLYREVDLKDHQPPTELDFIFDAPDPSSTPKLVNREN